MTPSMVTLPLASILSLTVSPTALDAVMVMTPWARRVVDARSVPRMAKS